MAKDLNNVYLACHGNIAGVLKALDEGKTVLAPVNLGPSAQESLKTGYSEHFKAKAELKAKEKNIGPCFGCNQAAEAWIYLYR